MAAKWRKIKKTERRKWKCWNEKNGKEMEQHLRFRRPSRTLYTRSWKAKSTAGRVGRCDNVFGWAGTICNRIAPPFLLSPIKLLLLHSSIVILNSIFSSFVLIYSIPVHLCALNMYWQFFLFLSLFFFLNYILFHSFVCQSEDFSFAICKHKIEIKRFHWITTKNPDQAKTDSESQREMNNNTKNEEIKIQN